MQPPAQKTGGQKGQSAGLLVLRICLGVYLCALGVSRISWLMDTAPLATQLTGWYADAPPTTRWYLERVLPGTPIFARVLPVAAMAGGVALSLGFWTRLTAMLCLLLVLNAQLASALIFKTTYLSNPNGLLLAGAVFALALGGGRLPLSLRK